MIVFFCVLIIGLGRVIRVILNGGSFCVVCFGCGMINMSVRSRRLVSSVVVFVMMWCGIGLIRGGDNILFIFFFNWFLLVNRGNVIRSRVLDRKLFCWGMVGWLGLWGGGRGVRLC